MGPHAKRTDIQVLLVAGDIAIVKRFKKHVRQINEAQEINVTLSFETVKSLAAASAHLGLK